MTICYISTHSSLDFNPSSEVATTQQTDSTAHKLKPRSFWQVCITELIAQSFYTLCIPKLTHRLLPPGVNCVWHAWAIWNQKRSLVCLYWRLPVKSTLYVLCIGEQYWPLQIFALPYWKYCWYYTLVQLLDVESKFCWVFLNKTLVNKGIHNSRVYKGTH